MENRIRELRKERGISQEELAKLCHVSRQTVNAIENNKYDPTLAWAFCRVPGANGIWNAFWVTEVITAVIALGVYHKSVKLK